MTPFYSVGGECAKKSEAVVSGLSPPEVNSTRHLRVKYQKEYEADRTRSYEVKTIFRMNNVLHAKHIIQFVPTCKLSKF